MAGPAFGAAGTRSSASSGASVTPALPTGIAAGMLLIAAVGSKNNAAHTWPAGWVKQDQQNSGTGWTVSWAIRIATGSDSAPAVTWSGSVANFGQVWRYTGSDQADPIGAVTHNAGTSSPHSCTGFTSTDDNSTATYLDGSAANTALTTPSGYTSRISNGSNTGSTHNDSGDKSLGASGSSSGSISTAGAAAAWVMWQIELLAPYAGQPDAVDDLPPKAAKRPQGFSHSFGLVPPAATPLLAWDAPPDVPLRRPRALHEAAFQPLAAPSAPPASTAPAGWDITAPESPRPQRREQRVALSFGLALPATTTPSPDLSMPQEAPRAKRRIEWFDASPVAPASAAPPAPSPIAWAASQDVPSARHRPAPDANANPLAPAASTAAPPPVAWAAPQELPRRRARPRAEASFAVPLAFAPPPAPPAGWSRDIEVPAKPLRRPQRFAYSFGLPTPAAPAGTSPPFGWSEPTEGPERIIWVPVATGEVPGLSQLAPLPPFDWYQEPPAPHRHKAARDLTLHMPQAFALPVVPPFGWYAPPPLLARRALRPHEAAFQPLRAVAAPPAAPWGWGAVLPELLRRVTRQHEAVFVPLEAFAPPPAPPFGWLMRWPDPPHVPGRIIDAVFMPVLVPGLGVLDPNESRASLVLARRSLISPATVARSLLSPTIRKRSEP
jgi:hypothetical protein